jgi:hypothetical protein
MAINLGKSVPPSKEVLRLFLSNRIKEEVTKLKIDRAIASETINTAIGVGNQDVWLEEYNCEYANTRIGPDPKPSKRKLKRVSEKMPKGIL